MFQDTRAVDSGLGYEERLEKLREKIKSNDNYKKKLISYLEKFKKNDESKLEYKKDLDISSKLKYKHIQEKALSCEMSAVSDIISNLKGKKVAEKFIISLVDKSMYASLPTKSKEGQVIWGNPNFGFVGYIDKTSSGEKASQWNMTGYGVLEKPINDIYKKFGFETKVITRSDYDNSYTKKDHLTEILKTINEGNMVQLWGDYCTDPNYNDSTKNDCKTFSNNRKLEWYYKENGKLIKHEGLAGEHAFYLLGYKGTVDVPSHIIVWDTMTGKHTYPLIEWYRKRATMQNRSIIIYKA